MLDCEAQKGLQMKNKVRKDLMEHQEIMDLMACLDLLDSKASREFLECLAFPVKRERKGEKESTAFLDRWGCLVREEYQVKLARLVRMALGECQGSQAHEVKRVLQGKLERKAKWAKSVTRATKDIAGHKDWMVHKAKQESLVRRAKLDPKDSVA